MTEVRQLLTATLRDVLDTSGLLTGRRAEKELQERLCDALGGCSREQFMYFDEPLNERPRPTTAETLAARERARLRGRRSSDYDLPMGGRDVLGNDGKERLDLLLDRDGDHFAIEIKCKHGDIDPYGYEFLRDLHKLERLAVVESRKRDVQRVPSDERFAAFLTTSADMRRAHPAKNCPQLCDGSSIEGPQRIQFAQTSELTNWYDYAPFILANRYELVWEELGDAHGHWLLLLTVRYRARPGNQPKAIVGSKAGRVDPGSRER